jgi:hypothetical protein
LDINEDMISKAGALLDLNPEQSGDALDSGNAIPDYVPDKNYFAVVQAAHDRWR